MARQSNDLGVDNSQEGKKGKEKSPNGPWFRGGPTRGVAAAQMGEPDKGGIKRTGKGGQKTKPKKTIFFCGTEKKKGPWLSPTRLQMPGNGLLKVPKTKRGKRTSGREQQAIREGGEGL